MKRLHRSLLWLCIALLATLSAAAQPARVWITPPIASGGEVRNLGGGLPDIGWPAFFARWVHPHLEALGDRPKGVLLSCPWGRPDQDPTFDFDQQLQLASDPRCAAMKDAELLAECVKLQEAGVKVIIYIGQPEERHTAVFGQVLRGALQLGDLGIDASIDHGESSLSMVAAMAAVGGKREFYVERAALNVEGERHWQGYPAIVVDDDGTRQRFRAEAIAAGQGGRRHVVIQHDARQPDGAALLRESLTWDAGDEPCIKSVGITPRQLAEAVATLPNPRAPPAPPTVGQQLDAAIAAKRRTAPARRDAEMEDTAADAALEQALAKAVEAVKGAGGAERNED